MAGEVHLGDDFYVASLGISDNLAQVLESVEHATAVLGVVKEFLSVAIVGKRTLAYGTHFGEFGVLGDVYAPTLVVGQMPVETVHLVKGHDVQHLLHLVLVEEVAGNVEHVATMSQVWSVLYFQTGQGPCLGTALFFSGKEIAGHKLLQCLQAIEPTAELRGLDGDSLLADTHGVGLLGKRLVGAKPYLAFRWSVACFLHLHANTGGKVQLLGKSLYVFFHLCAFIGNGGKRGKGEFSVLCLEFRGVGDEGCSAQLLLFFDEGRSVHELHGIVLVALVPKAHASVFLGSAP